MLPFKTWTVDLSNKVVGMENFTIILPLHSWYTWTFTALDMHPEFALMLVFIKSLQLTINDYNTALPKHERKYQLRIYMHLWRERAKDCSKSIKLWTLGWGHAFIFIHVAGPGVWRRYIYTGLHWGAQVKNIIIGEQTWSRRPLWS